MEFAKDAAQAMTDAVNHDALSRDLQDVFERHSETVGELTQEQLVDVVVLAMRRAE